MSEFDELHVARRYPFIVRCPSARYRRRCSTVADVNAISDSTRRRSNSKPRTRSSSSASVASNSSSATSSTVRSPRPIMSHNAPRSIRPS